MQLQKVYTALQFCKANVHLFAVYAVVPVRGRFPPAGHATGPIVPGNATAHSTGYYQKESPACLL